MDNLPNPNNEKRRPTRKILADIRIVCKYLDAIAEQNGFNTVNKRREELINFYNLVATVENGLLSRNDRRVHTQWRTAVCPIMKVMKDQNTIN